MKRLIFAIVLFLFIVPTYSYGKNTTRTHDLEENGYHGDIEIIIVSEYKLSTKFGEAFIDALLEETIVKFNQDGNILEMSQYDSDGDLNRRIEYTNYDVKGNLIEENHYDSDGRLSWKYTYNAKGNKIEESRYRLNGDLYNKIKCIYNENDKLIEENHYGSDGKLNWKCKYTYDEKSNLIEEISYNVKNVFEEPTKLTKYEIIYR